MTLLITGSLDITWASWKGQRNREFDGDWILATLSLVLIIYNNASACGIYCNIMSSFLNVDRDSEMVLLDKCFCSDCWKKSLWYVLMLSIERAVRDGITSTRDKLWFTYLLNWLNWLFVELPLSYCVKFITFHIFVIWKRISCKNLPSSSLSTDTSVVKFS